MTEVWFLTNINNGYTEVYWSLCTAVESAHLIEGVFWKANDEVGQMTWVIDQTTEDLFHCGHWRIQKKPVKEYA